MTGRPAIGLLALLLLATVAAGPAHLVALLAAPNADGLAITLSAGATSADHAFFRPLGSSRRSCATCHTPTDGWSLVPSEVQRRFELSAGTDPLFEPRDAAVSPHADTSTLDARRRAYALVLARGLIRVGRPISPDAEFELAEVADPYGFASASELSLFRRPLPATNLKFASTLTWDGRVTDDGRAMLSALVAQAAGAATDHANGLELDDAQRRAIVDFERTLVTAQAHDRRAGALDDLRAGGGPRALAEQPFRLAINSVGDHTGIPPTRRVFTIFDPWATADDEARRAIARGQAVFNERRLGASGLTCSGCHNTPNAGSSSTGAFFASVAPDADDALPLYTLRCVRGPMRGHVLRTSDPGWGLVTGRCIDVGKFKVPTLRGLAGHPPYFHNGSAATLDDVVASYDRRLEIGLSPQQRQDLAAFLRAL